ncbi:MAG: anti-sigma factor antagonist [Oscillospiraceae bacterium]|jgi:stage II sporulation protein AA (anti-sigma F factor antagonist)|nr:anti-sigma factor antagonist [Oscillospiraceae bacterium]
MPVRIETNGEVVTAYLEGELDHHSAKAIREEVDMAIFKDSPTLLVLDFRDITFMDSSGIGLIMGRYRVMSGLGGEVHVANPSPQIAKVMKLSGLDRLAQINPAMKGSKAQ